MSAMMRAGICAAISLTKSTGPRPMRAATSSAASATAFGLIASINLNAKVRATGARRRRWTSPLENSMPDLTKSRMGPETMPCINFASVSIWRVTSRVISSRC